ncbi:MAG: GTPase Era [Gammaproteobacteria bacterium]
MKCGFVALVGRPNVGKSTLLNHLIGQKISIISRKPQTTRHRILGIKTWDQEETQIIYVDTPGMHMGEKRHLNKIMNKTAQAALYDVDVIVWIIEAGKWTATEENILSQIATMQEKMQDQASKPVILAINKIDKIANKEELLPFIENISKSFKFHAIMPISALKNKALNHLESELIKLLPENPFFYEKETITDKNLSFRITEIVREKLMRYLGDELPYALNIEFEHFEKSETKNLAKISCVIWVEREGQKQIIIGKQGSLLKQIGIDSRLDLEKLLQQQVFLKLWVRVKENWSDDLKSLKQFGYWELEE